MLGRHSPQGELFRPDSIHLEHVGKDSFYGFLATSRHQLFRDRDFAGLYRRGLGRPSVPPSQLCIALLLQARDGVSDDEAIQRSAFDLRWKVALGIDIDEKLCAKSTLQLFRAKLILHDKYQSIFKASIEACRASGLMKRKKLEVAIDTTPVFGRGAVKDTFNLISDQIRNVVSEVVALKGYELEKLVAEQGLGRHYGSSFKSQFDVDWDDADQKRAVVSQLVADARAALELAKASLRGYAKAAEKTKALRNARDLLADLLLQDIEEEPEDGGGPEIRKGTAKDRIVSTTDPEMRHGRKSHSTTFKGYKASVVAETEDGVILATDVHPGNTHDRVGAAELVDVAGKNAKTKAASVLGDTAYGSMDTRREFAARDIEVVAKAAPPGNKGKVEFTLESFSLNTTKSTLTCPAGKRSIRRDRRGVDGWTYVFSRNDCNVCPMRSRCTTKKVGARCVTFTADTHQLQELRREQRTPEFRERYRCRVIVEHRIARLVQLGIRKARYFGQTKVAFQICLAAAVANLGKAASTAFSNLSKSFRSLCSTLALVTIAIWANHSESWHFPRNLSPTG